MSNKLSVNILPFLKINLLIFPIIASSLFYDYFNNLCLSYLCAFIHELSHIAVALLLGIKISFIEILPFGICARLKSDIISNPTHEILVALAGPFSNIIIVTALCIINKNNTYFLYCNLATAIINLIPALPLDGGRIMRASLSKKLGSVTAYNLSFKISRLFIILLISLSIYIYFTIQFNFSLILIGAFLMGNLFAEQRNISKQAMREFLHLKDKLKPDEFSRATIICASASTPARKILKLLSYNRYHIIHIIDDDMRVSKTITESELLDALMNKSIRITLSEI